MAGDVVTIAFNAGSSSLKIGIFSSNSGQMHPIGKGMVDFSADKPLLRYSIDGYSDETSLPGNNDNDFPVALENALAELATHLPDGAWKMAGHRVVHGGLQFRGPVEINDEILAAISALTPLAPLHQPQALRVIEAVRDLRPDIRQTASFDTAFHATQDDIVRRLAIPRDLHEEGIRRYGFHGLSYDYIASALRRDHPAIAVGRVIAAHLGSGASLCGMINGRSHDCSMGFSALDGIPMATRPGWIDPGVLLFLLKEKGLTPDALEDLLYHQCGLVGVSGSSGDTRRLLADRSQASQEAINLFALRIAGEIGRLSSTLGGIDAIVFTGGIGEHQPEIRQRIAQRLEWLGVSMDLQANAGNASTIHANGSRISLHVIPTDEERVIAKESLDLLHSL